MGAAIVFFEKTHCIFPRKHLGYTPTDVMHGTG
jgi:hypothetical protein